MPPKKNKQAKAKVEVKAEVETKVKDDGISEESFSISEEYNTLKRIPFKERKTSPYMSIYEYTALLNARTLQLSKPLYEDTPKVPLNSSEDYDPISIATRELKDGVICLVIRRTLSDGNTEDWLPSEMYLPRI